MFCRAAAVGAAVLTASGGLLASGAAAAPAPVHLTVVGSNTTQEVMGAITAAFDASSAPPGENAKATNVYAQPADPGTVAPSDAHCNGGAAITYVQEVKPAANSAPLPTVRPPARRR